MRFWVYVLLLAEDKYYVGATRQRPEARFRQHQLGKHFGAAWCKRYLPIKIVQTRECANEVGMLLVEKLTTFELMKVKGYEQVRGANYCQTKPLDLEQLCWDMGHLTGESATELVKQLKPMGPMRGKYAHLIDAPGKRSKYF
jgi:predicted GIY-YIG superfamily endonuclease